MQSLQNMYVDHLFFMLCGFHLCPSQDIDGEIQRSLYPQEIYHHVDLLDCGNAGQAVRVHGAGNLRAGVPLRQRVRETEFTSVLGKFFAGGVCDICFGDADIHFVVPG